MSACASPEFEEHRARLFGLAYRMLGSAADAEDVVQDAFLRWNGADHAAIESPSAWLAKAVTNLCLTRLTSARARRERYVGPWLPEPVLTGDGELGPLDKVEQRESVSLALLTTAERLTPPERAVFVLREAFGYSHREVAELTGFTEASSRQLLHRARKQIGEPAPAAAQVDRRHWQALVDSFLAAARAGDLARLERLLMAEVTAVADGGGKVTAARRPVVGRRKVARYLAGGMANFGAGFELSYAEINGAPAILGWFGERLVGLVVLHLDGRRISAMHIVANPDKLAFVGRQFSRPVTSWRAAQS